MATEQARRKLEEIRQKQKKAGERNQGKLENEELETLKLQLVATQNDRDELRKKLEGSQERMELLTRELADAQTQASNVAELKQTMKSLAIERDAAIMAKEDLLTQLRVTRKRLQEAEDEQYKAEEDAAVLRAELKHLQQEHSSSSQSLHTQYQDHYGITDHEVQSLKTELQDTVYQLQQEQQLRRQEQQDLLVEKQKVMKLSVEKQELEVALRNKEKDMKQQAIPAPALNEGQWKPKVDRGKHEQHVRELAAMVERLENGRQKLLAEIDMQSVEIEQLFLENAGLVNGLNETSEIAARWERQLREVMKQNAELHRRVEELKTQQAVPDSPEPSTTNNSSQELSETTKLKMDLTKTVSERDQLQGHISQLSLELASARHKLNGFPRLYGPVLSSLETRLLQIKQNPIQVDVTF